MSEEEFKKALEIIHNPIIVDSVEYKYFDKENYNKLEEIIKYSDYLYKKVSPYVEYHEEKLNKQKEVLDNIKEYCNNRLQYYNEMRRDYMREFDGYAENDIENILKLLEEIE